MSSPAPEKPLPPGLPRTVEIALAGLGLLTLTPLFILTAAAVAFTSPGPVLFRQSRVGVRGKPFPLFKFRSMRTDVSGQKFTTHGDARITPVGRWIRKTKIDELPQLWNVLRGDMSFVGPRPEVPDYVDLDDPQWRRVLEARPGLTHPLTIVLHPEEELLAKVTGDSKHFYDCYFLPYKLRGYLEYLEHRSAWRDLLTVVQTFFEILRPGRAAQPTPDEICAAIDHLSAETTAPISRG